jgi:hypothetical protein
VGFWYETDGDPCFKVKGGVRKQVKLLFIFTEIILLLNSRREEETAEW